MDKPRSIKALIYPAKDLERSKQFFTAYLCVEPYADSQYYVGYKAGDIEIGLDPSAKTQGPIAYIDVEDIKSFAEELTDLGAEIIEDARDVGGGLLVAKIKDTDGNILGIRQMAKS